MAEEDTTQDAAYSDEEFGSEHEDGGGHEEFAEEDAEIIGKQDAVEQERAAEAGEEDADDYDAEFDEDGPVVTTDGPPPIETSELPIERIPTDVDDLANDSQEDAERYDGEFDEDTPGPPAEEKNEAVVEQTSSDNVGDMPQNEVSNEKASPEDDSSVIHDQTDDNEAEYSVDSEPDAASSEPTILPRTLSEESVSSRRSSVPSAVIARLTEDFPPKNRFVRAGSMPLVLSVAPVDKWTDSIPQDLSPERHDRSRKQSACFPVQEETQQQNLAEEENNTDDAENGGEDGGTAAVPNAVRSHARAQSYRDLQSDKVAVPVRRTQSLLYTGSLPCVEEIHPSEEVADPPHSQEGDDTYSDDNGSDGEASRDSFESEHGDDGTQPTLPEHPKSGPSTAMRELHDHESNEVELTGDADSHSPALATPKRAPTPEHLDPPQSSKYDDDYADEMDDEFASDSEVPQFEGENTPLKSSGEASDYDVDEFIEEGRRETETLLQEARTLLELQQKEGETHTPVPEQQNVLPDPSEQPAGNGEEPAEQPVAKEEETEGTGDEIVATMYDDDDEFDTDTPRQPTPEQDAGVDNDGVGQYELDNDEFEMQDSELPQDELKTTVENLDKVDSEKVVDSDEQQDAKVSESLQPACEVDNDATKTESETPMNESLQLEVAINAESETPKPVSEPLQAASEASNNTIKAENETPALEPPSEQPALDTGVAEGKDGAPPAQATKDALSTKASLKTVAVKNEKRQAPTNPTESKRREPEMTATRPARPVKNTSPAAAQPSPPMKPSRPATNRTPAPPSAPPPSSAADKKPTTTPRSSRTRLKPSTVDHQVSPTQPAERNTEGKTTTTIDQTPPTQESPTKPRPKVSSPRSPSKTPSASYQNLPNEYPLLPRKAPVPRQKVKPSTSGDHGGKRRLLQPVRTPANLRFDLPKMDKTKRDWLFVNMFRHGDDLSKYESFVPPTLRARPPTSSSLKETKKRPLSARQVYGNPQPSRFVTPSRRLVQQPSPALQDRERNWVPTAPHDSKLPPYDSILDKFCTTVTSPVVQRHIYQTRYRDLSPQLAFVLEKRVEKQCRKGFYDSFGGVSSSYKTEIVPTSPIDGSRPRQMSPRSPTKSGMLPTTAPEG